MANVNVQKKDMLDAVHGSISLVKSVHEAIDKIVEIDKTNLNPIQKTQLEDLAAFLLDNASTQLDIIERMTNNAEPVNE